MNEGAYRDARSGVLQHIADADLAVKERSERMTLALMKVLPPSLGARIGELRGVVVTDDASFAELCRIAEQRIALVEALDEALTLAPELAAAVTETPEGTPDAPPQIDTWGPIGTEEAIAQPRAEVTGIAMNTDPDASVTVVGTRIVTRLTVASVPILWLIEFGAAMNLRGALNPRPSFLLASHVIEANVSAALPRLAIRREHIGDSLLKLFHRELDLELGDAEFDKLLFVEGDDAFAAPLLSQNVRSLLVDRAKRGPFQLTLDRGLLTLSWAKGFGSLVNRALFDSSAAVISALRKEATNMALVHDRSTT